MNASVRPINCGQIVGVENSGQFYLESPGKKITADAIVWLVMDGDWTCLVDFGPGRPETVTRVTSRTLIQGEGQGLEAALADAGVDVDGIDVIVQSHLHWDHSLGALDWDFPNATVLVQRSEYEYASAPYGPHRRLYPVEIVQRFDPSNDARIDLVDGDVSLTPRVRLAHTPGHSPGTQAVIVDTGRERIAVASDTMPYARSLPISAREEWLPPGVHTNLDDWYRTVDDLRSRADHVLPSHDLAGVEAVLNRLREPDDASR